MTSGDSLDYTDRCMEIMTGHGAAVRGGCRGEGLWHSTGGRVFAGRRGWPTQAVHGWGVDRRQRPLPQVKEMEAASIAWAANLFGKPLLCVKAITDIVDGERAAADEFLENLNAAAAALQGMVPRVIKFVAGRPLDQL